MKNLFDFKRSALDLVESAEKKLNDNFSALSAIALFNQSKVLKAFNAFQISTRHFAGTTGYGYDDIGRDSLAKVYANVFGAENAIVSPHILSGTHALTICLFGLLRPNDTLLSICGKPYDTMHDVINGENIGSLKDYHVNYHEIELVNNDFNYCEIENYCANNPPKVVYIQRSRGYEWKNALSIECIEKVCKLIKAKAKNCSIVVDNCYGEFTQTKEPTEVGATVAVGSLIKNPGGGITPTGAYIVGENKAIEQIGYRFIAPSVGLEIGSYEQGYREFFQGLFLSPHIVLQAIKGAKLFSETFKMLGYDTLPNSTDSFNDIICSIKFNTEDELISFCRGIQAVSPIDSHVTPYPWDMPGYDNQVIMSAGCFVQGASIELSADSPIKKPYIAYVQGALTYEHAKLAVLNCVDKLIS